MLCVNIFWRKKAAKELHEYIWRKKQQKHQKISLQLMLL